MQTEHAALAPNYIRSFCAQTVKATNDATREVLHLITNAAIDRAGDVVEPSGAKIDNFLRNPVVMVDHDYRTEKIVGRATSIEMTKDGIMARTSFRDTPLGHDAYKLAAEKLGGWSIGFRPLEYDSQKDEKGRHRGFRFKSWELLEYSLVAIPMNQEIVNNAIRRGLVSADHASLFFKSETVDLYIPAEQDPPSEWIVYTESRPPVYKRVTVEPPVESTAGDSPNVDEPKRNATPEPVLSAAKRIENAIGAERAAQRMDALLRGIYGD